LIGKIKILYLVFNYGKMVYFANVLLEPNIQLSASKNPRVLSLKVLSGTPYSLAAL
jgi:hypothetical protein